MEDGLGDVLNLQTMKKLTRLNPCFSGGWSRSIGYIVCKFTLSNVLILVLVEDGLGETVETYDIENYVLVLILVLVEDGLGEEKQAIIDEVSSQS